MLLFGLLRLLRPENGRDEELTLKFFRVSKHFEPFHVTISDVITWFYCKFVFILTKRSLEEPYCVNSIMDSTALHYISNLTRRKLTIPDQFYCWLALPRFNWLFQILILWILFFGFVVFDFFPLFAVMRETCWIYLALIIS